jgi:curved DNA-binding protein CbpA
MGNTNSSNRKYTYQQYYKAIIKKNQSFDFSEIDFSSLNPLEVFEISKNYTWNELKDAYRETAFLTHPDKEGGNEIVFNFVTECFKLLALEYKNRNANKTFIELKKQFQEENNYDNNDNRNKNDDNDDESFNEKFNKTFNMCRVEDECNDFGYGDTMIESSKEREDYSTTNLFKNTKFNNQTFNKLFINNVPAPKITKEIIKYKEPEPLVLAKTINYTELGAKKPDDYSTSPEKNTNNNLVYTDYKIAYSNQRLVDEETISNSIKNFKNLEDYEQYRLSKFNKKLSNKEIRYFEEKKLKEEKEEYERLERIKKFDIKIKLNNDKANKLLL